MAESQGDLLRDQIDLALGKLEIPHGWGATKSYGSIVYRPVRKSLPTVKLHYHPLMVDVDYMQNRQVRSKRIKCRSTSELADTVRDQLYEWS